MTLPDRLLVATGNPGKLEEIREILAPLGVDLVAPAQAGWDAVVEEDGATLEANALKKARAGVAASGIATLADDSGLFVDALDGAPGVHSARYAGSEQDAAANCVKLLRALRDMPPPRRGAAFRCVLAWVEPAGTERVVEGICRGHIIDAPRGTGGFGYDPLFVPQDHDVTFAQMPGERKHGLSHRGRALRALATWLQERRIEEDG